MATITDSLLVIIVNVMKLSICNFKMDMLIDIQTRKGEGSKKKKKKEVSLLPSVVNCF